jgi:indole-3-glycerol phosphate synthase
MTATILDKIVSVKRQDVEQRKRSAPVTELESLIAQRKMLDFTAAIKGPEVKLIAEVKKASPSRGVLCPELNPVELAVTYAKAGAAAISVLTEVAHFQGSLDYLTKIKRKVDKPLLRKDFIFDPYQVYESAAFGADAILLIAAILPKNNLEALVALSRRLGLASLVEVHNKSELEKALLADAEIIGINNRDLNTFQVDINTTRRLRPLVPPGCIIVSESGIKNREDMVKMKEWGVHAVLIGEALVTAGNVPAKIGELLNDPD